MSDHSPSRRGASPWVANLALLGVSLLLVAIAIEAGVRSLVDFDRHAPFGVLDVDHSGGGLSFLPSAERRYETSEFTFHARRHLNPEGYGLAADAIGAFLLDHDVP